MGKAEKGCFPENVGFPVRKYASLVLFIGLMYMHAGSRFGA